MMASRRWGAVAAGVLIVLTWLAVNQRTATDIANAEPGGCPPLPFSETDPLYVDAPAGSVITVVCVEPAGTQLTHFGPFTLDGTYGSGCFVVKGLGTAAVSVGEPRLLGCRGTDIKYATGAAPPAAATGRERPS